MQGRRVRGKVYQVYQRCSSPSFPMASSESKIVVAKLELKEEECKPTRNEARIARLKVDIAELELEEEECKPTRNEARSARLKVVIAKLELKEEEKGDKDPARIARLKVDIAKLELDEEEKGGKNPARIARLKVDIAKLELKEENFAETDKGTQIRLLLRPSPSCFLPPLPHASGLPSSQNSVQIFSRIGASFYYHRSGSLLCLFFRRTRRKSSIDGFRQDVHQPFCRQSLCSAFLVSPRDLQVSSHAAYSHSIVARGSLAIASTCKGYRCALVCRQVSPRLPLFHHHRRLCMLTTQDSTYRKE